MYVCNGALKEGLGSSISGFCAIWHHTAKSMILFKWTESFFPVCAYYLSPLLIKNAIFLFNSFLAPIQLCRTLLDSTF